MSMLVRARSLLRKSSPPASLVHLDSIDPEAKPHTKDHSYEKGVHNILYHSLIRSRAQVGLLDECWKWFCCYLDSSIKRDWHRVLQGVIKELGPTYPKEASEWPRQANNVYQVLRVVVDATSNRGEISIDGIIDGLMSAGLLRAGEKDGLPPRGITSDLDSERNIAGQMVWCLVGMITMLYDPKPPQFGRPQLSLRLPPSGLRSSGFNRPGEISCGQQDILGCRDTLHALLAQFGEVIPKVEVDQEYLDSVDTDYVNIAYINFHTLKHVAKIEIEWVNTLNLHLQLDKRRRILRLFRFPAFCRLAWTEEMGNKSFMSQLFEDHRKSQVNGDLNTEYTFSDYLREVMLSYRLLFGIDKRSRRAFKAELPAWRAGLPSDTNSTVPRHQEQQDLRDLDDPLLMLLCTTTTTDFSSTSHSSSSESSSSSSHNVSLPSTLSTLLSTLHGEEKSQIYDLEDFPFLGRRLADIQRFSLKQKPNDWKSLFWIDRRDPQSLWNGWITWIVVLIGGGSVFLQTIQVIFQIWSTFWSPNG